MKLIIKDDRLFIESEYTTGNKQWLAKIIGKHDKFEFEREFLNGTRKGLKISEIQNGALLEEVSYSHSGKSSSRNYFKVIDNKLTDISKKELLLELL